MEIKTKLNQHFICVLFPYIHSKLKSQNSTFKFCTGESGFLF